MGFRTSLLIRRPWLIENSLHFVKDCWRDADGHDLSMPGLGELPTCFIAVFVESGGGYCRIIEEEKETLDGGLCNGKGQGKTVSNTTRIPNLNQKTVLAHLVAILVVA